MRLRDGNKAIQTLSDPEPESLDDLEARLKVVVAGGLALSSLDDLGSDEANKQAWNDMLILLQEADYLRKKIDSLKNHS